jgi:hypothetical protein
MNQLFQTKTVRDLLTALLRDLHYNSSPVVQDLRLYLPFTVLWKKMLNKHKTRNGLTSTKPLNQNTVQIITKLQEVTL